MNARKDEQHRVAAMKQRAYLPMHSYDAPYQNKVGVFLLATACVILLGLMSPEIITIPLYWVCILICAGCPVAWAAWSYLVRGKYIYTDSSTGRKYAVREHGDQIIDCYQCSKDWVDIENKAIECINDADIPSMLPDKAYLDVACHCFTPETIKLYVEYPQEHAIRNRIDAAIASAYPQGSIQSDASRLDNGHIVVDYTIRHHAQTF